MLTRRQEVVLGPRTAMRRCGSRAAPLSRTLRENMRQSASPRPGSRRSPRSPYSMLLVPPRLPPPSAPSPAAPHTLPPLPPPLNTQPSLPAHLLTHAPCALSTGRRSRTAAAALGAVPTTTFGHTPQPPATTPISPAAAALAVPPPPSAYCWSPREQAIAADHVPVNLLSPQ